MLEARAGMHRPKDKGLEWFSNSSFPLAQRDLSIVVEQGFRRQSYP